MITVEYSTRFMRAFQKLPTELQDEVIEKVELLKNPTNHTRLKAHKLGGDLSGIWSFSVNYRIRITYAKISARVFVLETVGTHDEVY